MMANKKKINHKLVNGDIIIVKILNSFLYLILLDQQQKNL
jgi:hypothetical protein